MTARSRVLTAGVAVAAVLALAACGAGDGPRPGAHPEPDPAAVEATRAALDERADEAPDSVASWGVDPGLGLVTIQVVGERTPEIDRFLDGLDPATLRVEPGSQPVRPFD